MAQMNAFKSMLDYHAHLLLLVILNDDIISSGITHKYSINSGITCMLKIQPEISKKQKQFNQDGKKFGFPIFQGKKNNCSHFLAVVSQN